MGSPAETRRSAEKIVSVDLWNRFQAAGVDQRLQSNVSVHPPFLPKPVKVPFAFQNGKLNLIEPVQFEGISPSAIFHRASIHAVEGQFLADYIDPKLGQLGLIVVGKFAPEQEEERNSALAVFKRHNVPMHTFSSLESLIEEIRSFAHD